MIVFTEEKIGENSFYFFAGCIANALVGLFRYSDVIHIPI